MLYILLLLTDILVPFLIIRSRKVRFAKRNLQNNEEIIAVGQTHQIALCLIILQQILITSFSILSILSNDFSWGIFLFLVVLFVFLWINVVNQCREFVVTNKRVLLKVGIISRTTKEFRYEKIESCDVDQSVLGRLLDYGTVIISGVGGSKVKEPYVEAPLVFRQYLIDIINNRESLNPTLSPQATGLQFDPIAELKAYKKLCDEGVITPEDFEKKKREILDKK